MRRGAALPLLALLSAGWPTPAQERCGTAKDMVVRVRERIAQGAGPAEYESLLQLLKQATQICMGQGDAWYYRSQLERKLGKAQLADLSLNKARMFNSEALAAGAEVAPPAPVATTPARVSNLPEGEVRNKWALVVGVGAFRDTRIPALRFTAKDAADVAALLSDPRYGRFPSANVHLLTNQKATTVAIKSELNWLARSAGPDDLVVVYIASHGSPREMDTAGISYVITHDTEIANQDSLYATSLPMIDLADAVRTRVRARRAVVFLDTCYSGAAVPGARDLVYESTEGLGVSRDMLNRIRQGEGRAIITSSSARERSWEDERLGNGIFTYYLLEALRRDNGMAPVSQVFGYLKDRVVETVRKQKGVSQVPTLTESDQAATLVIGVAPANQ